MGMLARRCVKCASPIQTPTKVYCVALGEGGRAVRQAEGGDNTETRST